MTVKKPTALAASLLLSVSAFYAGPAIAGEFVGHAGLTFGYDFIKESDGSPDSADEPFAAFDVLLSRHIGQNYLLAFDAKYHKDWLSESVDFSDSEDPGSEVHIGAQLLRSVSDGARVGFYSSYSRQSAQDSASEDDYDVLQFGVSGQTNLGSEFIGYSQVGFGDKTRGEDDGEGFTQGYVLRGGLAYLMTENTTVVFDMQYASTSSYIDSDDPGRFFAASLSGESKLPTDMPLSAYYGLQRISIDSTDEGDHLSETQVFFGLRYTFGGESSGDRWRNGGAYGTPTLPIRASSWTEWAD